MFVRLQSEAFDPGAETNQFLAAHPGHGAFASFLGTVRSTPEKPVDVLHLEHYPQMAQKQIERFCNEAMARFTLDDIAVIHRYGALKRGEVIVLVMAVSAHRQPAIDGVNYVMDWLKTDAPFWKRETGPDGEAWVDAKAEDDAAKDKWFK